jgi:hypothetical protein
VLPPIQIRELKLVKHRTDRDAERHLRLNVERHGAVITWILGWAGIVKRGQRESFECAKVALQPFEPEQQPTVLDQELIPQPADDQDHCPGQQDGKLEEAQERLQIVVAAGTASDAEWGTCRTGTCVADLAAPA